MTTTKGQKSSVINDDFTVDLCIIYLNSALGVMEEFFLFVFSTALILINWLFY